jgi:hypothetical protein
LSDGVAAFVASTPTDAAIKSMKAAKTENAFLPNMILITPF